MNRYSTRWYTTTIESEVERLCAIDHTPAAEVRIATDVEPLHVHYSWVLWSDYKISRRCKELPQGGSLGPGAVQIISAIHDADGGRIEGGYSSLVEVEEVVEEKTRESHFTSILSPALGRFSDEAWTLQMKDGSTRTLFVISEGYGDGYMFEAFWSQQSARKFLESLNEAPASAPRPAPGTACHYCGQPATRYGWFDEPTCDECG